MTKENINITLGEKSNNEDFEIEVEEQLSVKDIYEKVEKLDRYIKKVQRRIDHLTQKLVDVTHLSKIEKEKLNKGLDAFNLNDDHYNA